MTVTIYGLASSEDGIIRYIGQTIQPLKRRLYTHTGHARNKYHKNYVGSWIRSVLNKGYTLNIISLEENAEWNTAEIKQIANYKNYGYDLVNLTNGGGGQLGIKRQPMSDELKEQIRQKKLGTKLTENHKKAIGLAQKNRIFSDEHKRKISEAKKGHATSANTREKISATLKGRKPSPEQVNKLRIGVQQYYQKRREAQLACC